LWHAHVANNSQPVSTAALSALSSMRRGPLGYNRNSNQRKGRGAPTNTKQIRELLARERAPARKGTMTSET
jgi:hypothetical protein